MSSILEVPEEGWIRSTSDARHRGTAAALTEVEVTLLDLSPDLLSLFNDALELMDPVTGDVGGPDSGETALLGIRLCYRAHYDFQSDTGDHWVDFPSRSNPSSQLFPAESLGRNARHCPCSSLSRLSPSRCRATGALRDLLEATDPDALETSLTELASSVDKATSTFSSSDVITDALDAVATTGITDALGLKDASQIAFAADDGSLSGLLRSIQPTLWIDDAGHLPLSSHGSTLESAVGVAEAIAASSHREDETVVIGDDFGDHLDASSAEQGVYAMQQVASQLILATRRPDVIGAFEAEQLVRLTVVANERHQFRLVAGNKASRVNRRLAFSQLVSAVTSPIVVLVEGPLDVEGYGAVAARLSRSGGTSLSRLGAKFVAPPGTDGGNTRLIGIAKLAKDLGFRVRVVLDSDKPGRAEDDIDQLLKICEQVVVLPNRTALEATLVRGIDPKQLRRAAALLENLGLPPIDPTVPDDDVADHLIKGKHLKKQGLHAPWVYALRPLPPLAQTVVEALCGERAGRVDIVDVR